MKIRTFPSHLFFLSCLMLPNCEFYFSEGCGSDFLQQSKQCDFMHILKWLSVQNNAKTNQNASLGSDSNISSTVLIYFLVCFFL